MTSQKTAGTGRAWVVKSKTLNATRQCCCAAIMAKSNNRFVPRFSSSETVQRTPTGS